MVTGKGPYEDDRDNAYAFIFISMTIRNSAVWIICRRDTREFVYQSCVDALHVLTDPRCWILDDKYQIRLSA